MISCEDLIIVTWNVKIPVMSAVFANRMLVAAEESRRPELKMERKHVITPLIGMLALICLVVA
jgi:hypothetical protein